MAIDASLPLERYWRITSTFGRRDQSKTAEFPQTRRRISKVTNVPRAKVQLYGPWNMNYGHRRCSMFHKTCPMAIERAPWPEKISYGP